MRTPLLRVFVSPLVLRPATVGLALLQLRPRRRRARAKPGLSPAGARAPPGGGGPPADAGGDDRGDAGGDGGGGARALPLAGGPRRPRSAPRACRPPPTTRTKRAGRSRRRYAA